MATKDIPEPFEEMLTSFLNNLGTSSATRVTKKLKQITTKEVLINKLRNSVVSKRTTIVGSKESEVVPTNVTKQMCILVNNIEMCKIKLADLDNELEEELHSSLEGCLRILRLSRDHILGVIIFRVTAAFVHLFGDMT